MHHHRPVQRSAVIAATLVAVLAGGLGGPGTAAAAAPLPDLGPQVTVFDPSMPVAQIQQKADEVWASQVDDEMGSARHSLYFKPGTYGTDTQPLQIKVGYYTEVAGLGASPGDVRINGKIEVRNRCFSDDPEFTGCFALNNFWRSLSNLTISVNGSGQDDCSASSNFWAVSQAVSLRRVDVTGGNLSLMDYCTGPSYASGGFVADSRAGVVINGSQQQWFTRNSEVGSWSNAVWNQVFSGVVGAPDATTYPDPPYSVSDTTPVSREKPYLFLDAAGRYQVRVPAAGRHTRGISWADQQTPGRTIALKDFFVARPGVPVATINAQLARGRHLLLTPGVYPINRSIEVKRADTVVLGMGMATLTAVNGAVPLRIADRPGVIVAGLTIDAGTVKSPRLLQIGTHPGSPRGRARPANPTTLSDVYFRVGGPHVGKVDVALEINSDHVLVDHTWVWRADHGVEGFANAEDTYGDSTRWVTNTGRNGVVVNGDHVTATGLFVEHFQQYNTIWNGEHGRVLFYQNELPYDPPTQADWTARDSTLGWAAYKVGDRVRRHDLLGGGVYAFNRNDPSIVTENGFEVPDAPGVVLRSVMTKNLSGPGTITHVVNGFGAAVDGVPEPGDPDNSEDPSYVVSYRNGQAVLP